MRLSRLLILIFIIIAPIVAASWMLVPINPFPQHIPSEQEISDLTLIDRTKNLEEVKALLVNYPNASASVDRVEHFGVEYHVVRGSDLPMLKVYLTDDGFPQSTAVVCGARGVLYAVGDAQQIATLRGAHLCGMHS